VDAILYVTENNLLAGGGSFKVPANLGTITAMSPLAELDTSLGIGPLLVGTTSAIFSVQAPVDRTTWQNLTYPIQSVALTGAGPVGPRNNCMANSDWWFRSLDGVRSFIAARQDFGYTDGKTPQSYEISPILAYDDPDLLLYGSQMNFDNRLYQTVSPYRTANGVAHRGLAVLNFDAVSTLNSEDPPVWESLNTGLNVLQLVYANDNGVERGFAFVVSDSGTIDLWEFSPEGDGVFTDQLETGVSATAMVAYTPIAAWLETRLMNFGDPFTQKKAITCELYLDEITDTVTVNVYLKPDQYPNWILWDTIDICATVSQCNVPPSCQVWQQAQTQYAARIMLKRPPESIPGPNATLPSNPMTGKPFDRFYELQCRLEITGHARVRKFRVQAKLEHQKMEGEAPKSAQCTLVSACPAEWFTYDAYGSQPSGPYLLDDQGNPILDDNGQPILV
jgi:hypothetical protein